MDTINYQRRTPAAALIGIFLGSILSPSLTAADEPKLPSYVTNPNGSCYINRLVVSGPTIPFSTGLELQVEEVCDTDGDGNPDRIEKKEFGLPIYTITTDNQGNILTLSIGLPATVDEQCVAGDYQRHVPNTNDPIWQEHYESCRLQGRRLNVAQALATRMRQEFLSVRAKM